MNKKLLYDRKFAGFYPFTIVSGNGVNVTARAIDAHIKLIAAIVELKCSGAAAGDIVKSERSPAGINIHIYHV